MADKSKISWCDATWNPLVGCSKVSEGCKNCWAEKFAARFHGKYPGVTNKDGKWTGRIHFFEGRLEIPFRWKQPRRIFVCSMGDLFHTNVPTSQIENVFDTMKRACHHTYLLLTKRLDTHGQLRRDLTMPDHIWLGATVENQHAADMRIEQLIRLEPAHRYLSCEPLLGKIQLMLTSCREDDTDLEEFGQHIDWVVVGCESINGRPGRFREGFIEAAIDIVRQCKDADVPVFVKQIPLGNRVSHTINNEWPTELRHQEFPQELKGDKK